jgi:glycosyltransferase involved in cell wall biosynthesis
MRWRRWRWCNVPGSGIRIAQERQRDRLLEHDGRTGRVGSVSSTVNCRIAVVGGMHVGVETVFRNVSKAAAADASLEVLAVPIESHRSDDPIERWLWFLPASMRGNVRYLTGSAPLFAPRRLDAVWTLLDIPLLPWMLFGNWRRRVALVYATDSTPRQLRAFGPHYNWWGGRSDLKFRLREMLYGAWLRRAAAIQAYTEWAARSLREDYGVPASRVHLLPPGVDTAFWTPAAEPPANRLPRLLFVGGDFHRKGGDLLLDVFRERFRGRAELHMVTGRGRPEEEPGVRVHTGLRPNDARLQRLYQECDLLVIPTRADCFSMAGLEGMSSGLPLVTCPVGGVGEVFEDGRQGRYVPPDDGRALGDAIEALLFDEPRRRTMGAAARELAVRRYDAAANTRSLLEIIRAVTRR